MPWTPRFWISEKDYDKVKRKLPRHESHKFHIFRTDGVVIDGGELSKPHEEIDRVLKKNKIEHWIINGEGTGCTYCEGYGDSIRSFHDDPKDPWYD